MGGIIAGVRPIATGSEASPGLPFAESPLNGIYKPAASGGYGITINGKKQFDLFDTGFVMGYKPATALALQLSPISPLTVTFNGLAVPPDGAHVFTWTGGGLDVHTVNPVNGNLTLLANYVVACDDLVISPDGLFVYAHNYGASNWTGFSRNVGTGALTSIGTFLHSGYGGQKSFISPDGLFLYTFTFNFTGTIHYISMSGRNPVSGTLTAPTIIYTDATYTASWMTISIDGNNIYCIDTAGLITFSRDPLTGLITFVSRIADANLHTVEMSGDDLNVYTANNAGTIKTYRRDTVNGALTLIEAALAGVSANKRLIMSQSTDRVYACDAANVTGLERSPTTGLLTPVGAALGLTYNFYTEGTPTSNNFIWFGQHTSSKITVVQTSSSVKFNLLDLQFDPFGDTGGIFSINGSLKKLGVPILDQLENDARYQLAAANEFITGTAVANFAALPSAAANSGKLAIVLNATGVWPLTYNAKGIYRSDGAAWIYQGDYALTEYASQLLGTNTNDNAAATFLGEFITATVAPGAAVALTTATPANVTSISLTPGDWDVSAVVGYVAGATTSLTRLAQSVSQTTATLGNDNATSNDIFAAFVPGNTSNIAKPVPVVRISLNATTTFYLVARGDFTVSTLAAYGTIRARRVR